MKILPVVLNVGHNFNYCDNTAILYYRRTEVMMLDHTKGRAICILRGPITCGIDY